MSQGIKNRTQRQYPNRVKQDRKPTGRRDREKLNTETKASKGGPDISPRKNEKAKLEKGKNILKRR